MKVLSDSCSAPSNIADVRFALLETLTAISALSFKLLLYMLNVTLLSPLIPYSLLKKVFEAVEDIFDDATDAERLCCLPSAVLMK